MRDGTFVAVGAALGAALREVVRLFKPRRSKAERIHDEVRAWEERLARERESLDEAWARLEGERKRLLAEVREELEACRERADELEAMVRAERMRVALLIRVMHEAGLPVPDAALLDIEFDAATGMWRLRERA